MRYRFHIVFLLISILMGMFVIGFSQNSDQKIRVATIGDSVTKGYGLKNPDSQSYPAQLQALLGSSYHVENFGVSGATLLSKGHRPYVLSDEYQRALAFKPQVVIIHLGLNDTDPRNWPNFRDEFVTDYLKIIGSFQSSDRKSPKVFICRITPIFNAHPRFKSGTRDWFRQIQQQIEQVAKAANVDLIDLHTPLYSVLFSGMVVTSDLGDSLDVHPKGKREVGERFAKLALAKVYGQKLEYSGPGVLGFKQTNEQISIQFDHANHLKTSNGLLLCEFEVAGQDGVFKPVKASIEGKEIVIQTTIMKVQKIRYGWNPFSRGNLVNEAGLPASTFEIELP